MSGTDDGFTPNTTSVRIAYTYIDDTHKEIAKGREEAFDRWFAAVKADAWDEGHSAGHDDYVGNDGTWPTTPNPYRT